MKKRSASSASWGRAVEEVKPRSKRPFVLNKCSPPKRWAKNSDMMLDYQDYHWYRSIEVV
jgi:hypothetical protein